MLKKSLKKFLKFFFLKKATFLNFLKYNILFKLLAVNYSKNLQSAKGKNTSAGLLNVRKNY